MALRLLLDEHLSPRIAVQLVARNPVIMVTTFQEWQRGGYLHASDPQILEAARRHGLTLVTYDQRTITALLRGWGERGIAHGGVVFVHQRTPAPSDIGGLVLALSDLWETRSQDDWTNHVAHLKPPER